MLGQTRSGSDGRWGRPDPHRLVPTLADDFRPLMDLIPFLVAREGVVLNVKALRLGRDYLKQIVVDFFRKYFGLSKNGIKYKA